MRFKTVLAACRIIKSDGELVRICVEKEEMVWEVRVVGGWKGVVGIRMSAVTNKAFTERM